MEKMTGKKLGNIHLIIVDSGEIYCLRILISEIAEML